MVMLDILYDDILQVPLLDMEADVILVKERLELGRGVGVTL
jgi:hypothetical protein